VSAQPHRVIAALVERGARGLMVIANDTARPGVGIGKLITAGCVAADGAADTVIAEANEIVPLGVLAPDAVHVVVDLMASDPQVAQFVAHAKMCTTSDDILEFGRINRPTCDYRQIR
jgi:acyl CoA:acetate/3-ketoacid CoA transferase alpha subunit